jgi:AraC-like DNA-binding protein
MSVARQLERTTDLPLSEIAKQVGYNSYNGFWRAYKPQDKLL